METTFPTPPPLSAPALTNVRTWTALCHATGQARRLRARCARQRSAQLPDLDAHLQRRRRGLLPDPGRLRFPRRPLGPERRLRHHRLHPGQRRKILPLPDNDPVHSVIGATDWLTHLKG